MHTMPRVSICTHAQSKEGRKPGHRDIKRLIKSHPCTSWTYFLLWLGHTSSPAAPKRAVASLRGAQASLQRRLPGLRGDGWLLLSSLRDPGHVQA